ncbi:LPS-assembly lipoprotein [Rhizomicrobium palustre]|uniref:LPS-assembly lipoprotein n=1 Tax=Rhizomicrobium palustre TaxID=189966 RepID=A0A846MX25_9PROT|nr:LPS assembly lipoprotein LptE [Rhizomicrobium palustre]NIK88108.1 LPS-assembly lipoprotein [Rhizomicrobium palustre]
MTKARALLAVLALPLLAGCGFRPLYATPDMPKGAMQAKLRSIYVEPIPEKTGYQMRTRLIDLIDGQGEARGASYYLRVNLTIHAEAIGVQSQTTASGITQTAITRYNDTLKAEYELIDPATGNPVTKGVETGLTAYNVLSSPYATLANQQDADRRAAEDIADRIRINLAVYFAEQAKK